MFYQLVFPNRVPFNLNKQWVENSIKNKLKKSTGFLLLREEHS